MSRPLVAPTRRRAAVAVAAVVVAGLVPGALAPPASGLEGAGVIRAYRALVTVEPDGSLRVEERMSFDEGALVEPAEQQIGRTLTTRESYDADDDRVFRIDDVAITVDGEEVDADVTEDDDVTRVTYPMAGTATVTWSYSVSGAVASTADGLEVRWPVLQGFDRAVVGAQVEWNAPGVSWLSCLVGPPGSGEPCTTSQLADVPTPVMTQLEVPVGAQMVGILGLAADSGIAPNAELEPRTSFSRSFTATGTPLAVALGLLGLALLSCLVLWWARGRDRSDVTDEPFTVPIVEAGDGSWLVTPPGGIRPGQMGTLVDERADVVDVSATLLDLATRNYLFIEELPRERFGRPDWLLRRRNDADDGLLGYERLLHDTVFAETGEVRVSGLPQMLSGRLGPVQQAMYADMVAQGWFNERPDAVRTRWSTAGWVLVVAGVVLTGVLAVVGTYGLVGLAVVLGGVGLVGTAQVTPARTATGSRMLGRLRAFREWLGVADLDVLDDVPVERREEVVARLIPYAVVFGAEERWVQALADLDTDADPDEPLHWYGAPSDWHLSDVDASLANLVTSLNAAIGSRALLAD